MITNWTFTDVPPRIDLSVPLMPNRDDEDRAIYGVDPAWLHEVLAAWYSIFGGTPAKAEMPPRPSADFTNEIYAFARGVKSNGAKLYTSAPAEAFVDPPAEISLGYVPSNVEVGDPVRRVDVSAMFDWMIGARFVSHPYTHAAYTIPDLQQLQHSEEGSASDVPFPGAGQSCVYDWAWVYEHTEHDGEVTFNGGRFHELRAPNFSSVFGATNAGAKIEAAWFARARVYAVVQGYAGNLYGLGPVTRKTVYVPCGTPNVLQDGDGISFSATFSASDAVSALLGVGGMPERAEYKDADFIETSSAGDYDYTSGYYRWSAELSSFLCLLELADDYRV